MAREIVNIEKLSEKSPFSKNQIYKLIRKDIDPLPHKKIGRNLYFDLERFYRWYDRQLGRGK
jgi:hypothetical protein